MFIINFFNFRSRLTSTGEDEREYQSEHETSWDEFDDRYDNFTAGRERLQEFNGRIPPRKKKKELPKPKSEKKVRKKLLSISIPFEYQNICNEQTKRPFFIEQKINKKIL